MKVQSISARFFPCSSSSTIHRHVSSRLRIPYALTFCVFLPVDVDAEAQAHKRRGEKTETQRKKT